MLLAHRIPWLAITLASLISLIFFVDISMVKGVVVGVLYVSAVYIAGWFPKKWVIYAIALLCTILTISALFLALPGGIFWMAVTNRFLSVLAIWATVALSLFHRRMEEENKVLRGLLRTCSYCRKICDERGNWVQMEAYISGHSEADFSHGVCPDCTLRHFPELAARYKA